MEQRRKLLTLRKWIATAAVVAFAGTAFAQAHPGKLQWTLRVNATPGPIRTAEVKQLTTRTAVSEILAGPTNGSPNGYFIYTRMGPGASGPALFTLPVDHDYAVLYGKMTIMIGNEKFVVGPNTGVIIPPGIPHRVWNAENTPEAHLELITAADPTALSRDLITMLKPAQPKKVENAAHYIREVKLPQASELGNLGSDLDHRIFTNKRIDPQSPNDWRIDTSMPGGGFPGSDTHIHRFEQIYFQLEGETTVQIGLDRFPLKVNQIVILLPGVVHTNANMTNVLERHIEASLPEPDPNDPSVHPIGVVVEIKCQQGKQWVHCPAEGDKAKPKTSPAAHQ